MKSKIIIPAILVLAILCLPVHLCAAKAGRGVKVTAKSPGEFGELYGKSYAVVIGINNYEKWPSLEYAVNDANAMEKKLKALGFATISLINQHATRDNILKILGDELPRKVEKNDRVIIFFAGHGQTEQLGDDSQMGYIIPVDADTTNIFSTAISMDQVRVFSRRMRAKHVLYLIDSCYAGLGLTRSGSIPPHEKDYLRKITSRKAHQMLVAGGRGELAHEEGSHGVFTKYVLEALDGAADQSEKGYVTFSDISSYVKPKVSRQTR
ncbi:MAG TPA: caspase family protein, partial [Smithellaceae bacterium]|nr:caspase family protein [Smithellaceae bacterium]